MARTRRRDINRASLIYHRRGTRVNHRLRRVDHRLRRVDHMRLRINRRRRFLHGGGEHSDSDYAGRNACDKRSAVAGARVGSHWGGGEHCRERD